MELSWDISLVSASRSNENLYQGNCADKRFYRRHLLVGIAVILARAESSCSRCFHFDILSLPRFHQIEAAFCLALLSDVLPYMLMHRTSANAIF